MKTHKVGFSDPAFMHELSSGGGPYYFFLNEITISSHVTHLADCASNISHDESSLRWRHPPKTNIDKYVTHHPDCVSNSQDERTLPSSVPPKTNIDDAEDVTAGALQDACIDAAAVASPVSKLTTSTSLQTLIVPPPMMYNLPEMKQHQTTRKELMQMRHWTDI